MESVLSKDGGTDQGLQEGEDAAASNGVVAQKASQHERPVSLEYLIHNKDGEEQAKAY